MVFGLPESLLQQAHASRTAGCIDGLAASQEQEQSPSNSQAGDGAGSAVAAIASLVTTKLRWRDLVSRAEGW